MLKVSGTSDRLLVLFFCLVLSLNIYGQTTGQEELRIASLLERVENENRIVDELIANNLTNLPVGIKKTISGTKIVIAIDSARLTPEGMIISAYTSFKLPGTLRPVALAAHNVLITPSGISQTATSRLVIINEFVIPLNDQVKLILPADGRNYIEWDCNGFRSVNLGGFFEFSGEVFIPDPVLSFNKDKVTAGFEVNTTDFNNIMINISIDAFRVKGLGDMTFVTREATVDLSDFINCQGFVTPPGYLNDYSDSPQLWRGFFLKKLTVFLPSELSSSAERTEINVQNILIDEFGMSGRFSASRVLPVNSGIASGWPMSVDRISVEITQNRLSGGDIEGVLRVPFLGSDTLSYSARIESSLTGLQYSFLVETNPSKDYSVPFGGTVKLDKGCIFGMKVLAGKFIPFAILNGSLSIQKDPVRFEALRFEGLHLIAEKPYLIGGTFASATRGGIKLSGFEVALSNLTFGVSEGNTFLGFDVKLALMGKNEKGVSAETRFFVNASVEEITNQINPKYPEQKWKYAGTVIQRVLVKGNVSIFSINGEIEIIKDHPVYGNGFYGNVGFMINKIFRDTAKVEVFFGTKVNYKYWYAKIDIPTDIPAGGAITLSKIAGGAYNNMEKREISNNESEYIPRENGGLGFIAQAGFYVKEKELFNADARFEIAFNGNYGVRFIRFSGNGNFFSKTDGNINQGDIKVSPVMASVNMIFDNENNVFHANLKVYMNLINAIQGNGPGGLMGEAVIHCDPSDWYIYIGRPSMPLGVSVAGLFETQIYFMAGTKIEDMPLPPSEVSSIIRNIDMDFMKNENAISSGRGVVFGIRFSATAGIGEDKGFVYAYFNAGAGADILLRNYGRVQCEGRSGPIGIDGWYASGQGYAYLIGKIGVRIKNNEFDIMSVAGALLVQAKMPDPTWFQGNIAARYSILGGLVKGKVNVAVTLGEKCTVVSSGDDPGEIKLIGDIEPAEGNREVDVFAAPQVSFNTGIDKEFGMMNLADQYTIYRVKLDYFRLLAPGNQSISGTVELNNTSDMATMKLQNTLPGKQTITASVKVHVEKKSQYGVWESIDSNSEIKESTFITGAEPKSIPLGNVLYSYPLKNQYNFYINEYPQGYIRLKSGQPNLFFEESEGNKWCYLARFKTNNGTTAETTVRYSDGESMIYFDIPKTLTSSSVYNITIIKKPLYGGAMDRNLRRREILISTVNSADSLSVSESQLSGTISSESEIILHSYSFRSSMYSTFTDKLNSMTNWNVQFAVDVTLMSLLGIRTTFKETFDKYEIDGSASGVLPLVTVEALRGNAWIDSHVYPQVYELYGTAGLTLNRNTDVLGIIPLKAMTICNSAEGGYLLNGKIVESKPGDVFIRYLIPHWVYADFSELRNKAAAMFMGKPGTPPQAQRLLAGSIDDISRGTYSFKINYRLPGQNNINTSKVLSIKY